MIFTLIEVNEQIASYKKALIAVSKSQEYRIDGKRLTRADLPQIRETLTWLSNEKSMIVNSSAGPHILSGRVNRG